MPNALLTLPGNRLCQEFSVASDTSKQIVICRIRQIRTTVLNRSDETLPQDKTPRNIQDSMKESLARLEAYDESYPAKHRDTRDRIDATLTSFHQIATERLLATLERFLP